MRGIDHQQADMFSYLSPEQRARKDHPLRAVRVMTDEILNRDRLLEAAVAKVVLAQVLERARAAGLVSDQHFTVDGTLLDAWASLKSFRPKEAKRGAPPDDPGNPTVNFHGQKRSNETHESKTDPDAKLARKGRGEETAAARLGELVR